MSSLLSPSFVGTRRSFWLWWLGVVVVVVLLLLLTSSFVDDNGGYNNGGGESWTARRSSSHMMNHHPLGSSSRRSHANPGQTRQQQHQQGQNGMERQRRHQEDDDEARNREDAESSPSSSSLYWIGTGIYDITGPAAQVNLMGYAKLSQNAHGIHQRLRARAFIISSAVPPPVRKSNHQDTNHGKSSPQQASAATTASSAMDDKEEGKVFVLKEENGVRIVEPGDFLRRPATTTSTTTGVMQRGLKWLVEWGNDGFYQDGRAGHSEEDTNNNKEPDEVPKLLDPSRTVCFVSIDTGMGSDLLNQRVLERLQKRAQEAAEKDDNNNQEPSTTTLLSQLCTLENLSISGTHTHSAPGGFLQYAVFQLTSLGFWGTAVLDTYAAGVAAALQRAHDNLQPGDMQLASAWLFDANINRSPSSYLLNPATERDAHADEGDTDKTMLQLSFYHHDNNNHNQKPKEEEHSWEVEDDEQDAHEENKGADATTGTTTTTTTKTAVGVLNWFAVHGTSMNSSNRLISGDNKGYASYLMEKRYNGNMTLPGRGSFVAAFASTNLGDVSPNTAGPRCLDTGLPCDDSLTSTCPSSGKNNNKKGSNHRNLCVAVGPGRDMFESTEIIGRKQYDMAVRLHENRNDNNNNNANHHDDIQSTAVQGNVAFRHSFVRFSHLNVTLDNGTVVQTCDGALGYSFAAGTTDGPGDFNFHQGTNTSNPFWNTVRGFLSKPTPEQVACHAPKPILLNVGTVSKPYRWEPRILPISIFQIGQLYILNVPAEFTTMAGRRLRQAVRQVLVREGKIAAQPVITIAGLANSYAHYVTTWEEYGGQRYEAASTLYGPYTLAAYIQEFRRLTRDLLADRPSNTTRKPPADLTKWQLNFVPAVEFDTIGLAKQFGSVAVDARDSYKRGETVVVSFRSANPRNDLRIEDTYLTVDRLDDYGQWQTLYVDGDWCTRYYWKGGLGYFGESFAEIHWTIPKEQEPLQGLYRICHAGTQKTLLGDLENIAIRAAGWLVTTFLGSPGLSTLLSTIDFSSRISPKMQRWLNQLGRFRYREFHGCTRTFLVHNTS